MIIMPDLNVQAPVSECIAAEMYLMSYQTQKSLLKETNAF
jgi:hypothetical protein